VIDLASHENRRAVDLDISAAPVESKAMETITALLARLTKQQDEVLDEVKRLSLVVSEQSARLAALEKQREP